MRITWTGVWGPLRRALYLAHRWLGMLGCVLFVLWFVSGLVMLHVRFPSLTPQERLQRLAPVDVREVRVPPQEALDRLGLANPRSIVLERQGAAPAGLVWRVLDAGGHHHVVSAIDAAKEAGPVSTADAEAIAQAFGRAPARYIETRERDPWTMPNSGPFDKARPLHRVALDDAAQTELYISAKTGEVVRDTNAHERFWTNFGTLLHYYTYAPIRQHPAFWRQLVLWTSGLAMVVAASGLLIGILRLRIRRRYRGTGSPTPYRGWMAWHHVLGLVGGITLCTWIFSGWFSMSPNQWLSHRTPADLPARFGQAGSTFTHSLDSLQQLQLSAGSAIKVVEAGWFAGRPTWTVRDARDQRFTFDALSAEPTRVTRAQLLVAARVLYPGVAFRRVSLISEPDLYWYSRHTPAVLPVWRIELADAASTWLHIDAVSGRLLSTSSSDSRLRRWLFNGLHSLDFPFFLKTPLWYATVWLLSLIGLAGSVSGVVLGWRRLRQMSRRAEPSALFSTEHS
jgi:hypothetical protein